MRILGIVILSAVSLLAAEAELSPARVEEVIKTFAANEAAFAKAREVYTYRQTARILDLDRAGNTVGRWETVSDIIFDRDLKRTEKVVRAPISTLKNFDLGPDDLKDLKDVQPFVLTTASIPNYDVRYLGNERLDELDCYAFAVKPKKMIKGERYFSGIVWVDQQDVQVVRTYGRGVGIQSRNQAFPKFETTRQKIDGQFWFPVYTIADDTLYFENSSARIRQTVKYEDYKRFTAESRIIGDVEEAPAAPAKPPAPAPAKK
jgi:hypothetical protein